MKRIDSITHINSLAADVQRVFAVRRELLAQNRAKGSLADRLQSLVEQGETFAKEKLNGQSPGVQGLVN